MNAAQKQLEAQLGYSFSDPSLLKLALTHRSWINEARRGRNLASAASLQNERLEFVGDSVLGFIIAENLYENFPNLPEGDLTLMKHHLVSTETLALVAQDLDLGIYVRFGKGEQKSGGKNKNALLANTLEAVIAAIYFDSDYLCVRQIVLKLFAKQLTNVSPENSLDHKTTLQELLQANKYEAPVYTVTKIDGPPHERKFTVQAEWYSGRSEGRGSTIKAAEMNAASSALKILASELEKTEQKR